MNMSQTRHITSRSAVAEDFEQVKALCEKRFGEGYINREEFSHWLDFPELFRVAMYEDSFAGFAFLMPEKAEDLAKSMQLSIGEIGVISGGKPLIHCRSAALVPECEHYGIMQMLLSEELDISKRLGFGAAFAPAWKYRGEIPMEKLMDTLGFKKLCERRMLWYDHEDYTCIICGGRCICDAVIYVKQL